METHRGVVWFSRISCVKIGIGLRVVCGNHVAGKTGFVWS